MSGTLEVDSSDSSSSDDSTYVAAELSRLRLRRRQRREQQVRQNYIKRFTIESEWIVSADDIAAAIYETVKSVSSLYESGV